MQIKKFDSMNVVPFIDIMLVLLVIVLTTATFIARGVIPIDLSDAKSSNKIKQELPLEITIKSNGDIFFNKEQIDRDDIIKKLEKVKLKTSITISCDKNSKFENFVYIIDILKDKGYKNLGIVTKYE
ncbi:Biopolymer transport protein ExbD/TolR [hydrothermal vent metagenome]|uniref:Biopolymer transport protein ExbD/TolR n=1 Tax=hydrothermal vent metagenome TaxID=652676 RepID=A0A1W1EI34_9ZZZZ